MTHEELLAGLRELTERWKSLRLAMHEYGHQGAADAYRECEADVLYLLPEEQSSPTPADLTQAAASVATQQRELVERMRVEPTELKQEVRQSAAGKAQACYPNRPVTHLVVISREGVPEVTEFRALQDAKDYFDDSSIQWSESYLTEVLYGPGRPLPSQGKREEQADGGEDEQFADEAFRLGMQWLENEDRAWPVEELAGACDAIDRLRRLVSTLRAQVATLTEERDRFRESAENNARIGNEWRNDAAKALVRVEELEAQLVESEQALSVANSSWTEAVRQRDTRIAELESQLEELHEWTSSDERERLVLDLQRCHESLDKAMRERDSYMCTADSAEQKHTDLLSEHVKATGNLGRALLEIGRLEAQLAELKP